MIEPVELAEAHRRTDRFAMNEDQLTTVILASVMLILLATVIAALRYNWLDLLASP